MQKRNDSFICLGCKCSVSQAEKTSRNHCPQCFLSLHVDANLPGDRASECTGWMFPCEYIIANGKTKIHFACRTCGKKHRNKAASDDEIGHLDEKIRYRKEKSLAMG